MEVEFSPVFLAQLAEAEAADPALAEALREVMATMRQAAAGGGPDEFLAALERLGVKIEPIEPEED